jgi:hypothetical protein
MKTHYALGLLFLGAGATTAGLLHSTAASAVERKVSAAACYAGMSYNFLYSDGVQNSIGGSLICPVPDDDLLRKEDAAEIALHGYDASATTRVRVSACVAYFDARGAICGASAQSSIAGVGHFTLLPALTVFDAAHAADYGFLLVSLPSPPSDDFHTWSSVRGYTLSD